MKELIFQDENVISSRRPGIYSKPESGEKPAEHRLGESPGTSFNQESKTPRDR